MAQGSVYCNICFNLLYYPKRHCYCDHNYTHYVTDCCGRSYVLYDVTILKIDDE